MKNLPIVGKWTKNRTRVTIPLDPQPTDDLAYHLTWCIAVEASSIYTSGIESTLYKSGDIYNTPLGKVRITKVTLQRLGDVTEEEAAAEGTDCRSDLAWGIGVSIVDDPYREAVNYGHRAHLREIWNECYAGTALEWRDYLLVWGIQYEAINELERD